MIHIEIMAEPIDHAAMDQTIRIVIPPTKENSMNKAILMFGEMRVSEKGLVHQEDFARALSMERVTTLPKDGADLTVVVGKLLGGRKPAQLVRAENRGYTAVSVADVLNDQAKISLKAILAQKPRLEWYEKAAFELLAGPAPQSEPPKEDSQLLANVFPMPKKRGKKKSDKTA